MGSGAQAPGASSVSVTRRLFLVDAFARVSGSDSGSGVDGSDGEDEGIGSGFTGIHVLTTGVVSFDRGDISEDGLVVDQEVLLDSSLKLGGVLEDLGPGDDGGEVGGDGLAVSKLSGEGSSDSHEILNSSGNVIGLGISEGLSEVSLEGLATIVTGLNFGELILLNKSVEKSSDNSGYSLGGDWGKGNGLSGVDRSDSEDEGIGSGFAGIEVLTTGVIGFNGSDVSEDGLVVNQEVLLDGSLKLGGIFENLSPCDDGRKVGGDGFAVSELSGEGSDDSHEVLNSCGNVIGLGIGEGLSKVSLKGLATIVASLNFGELVLLNESVKKSSDNSSNRLGGDRGKGNGLSGVDGSDSEDEGIGRAPVAVALFLAVILRGGAERLG